MGWNAPLMLEFVMRNGLLRTGKDPDTLYLGGVSGWKELRQYEKESVNHCFIANHISP
jgi:hypothetical protein